ncbi:hypothetical protein [Flammeovirga sp. SJP92]|uniref:hypothetical protein n=1 Tax=Flammeovirga sp. SJP92 TaxID=1775430 RepID=UPI0012F788B8|nr:hypothetical protein [Flammeovirga sp. SJP92]
MSILLNLTFLYLSFIGFEVNLLVQNDEKLPFETKEVIIDWGGVKKAKALLLEQINANPTKCDTYIYQFFEEYSVIENKVNEQLFALSNYDSLNTLAYAPNDTIYEVAINFEIQAEDNGFTVAMSEGMIFLSKNTSFIKKNLLDKIDSTSIEFINLYCDELDKVCCEDASIIIDEKELVERAYRWGEMSKKSEELKYAEISEDTFKHYLYLIFEGQDNSPSFEFTTHSFNPKLIHQMTKVTQKHPDSRASAYFKTFLDLLAKSEYKKSEEIKQYIHSL